MENSGRPTGERILLRLKTRGPQTAADLGDVLGITTEGARQHLARLAEEGLVEAKAERRGVGRPAQVYGLTAKGHERFPDAHAELAVQLIDGIRAVLGEDALARLVAAREAETRAHYAAALEGARDLEERISRLAALRAREGYMAEWRREGKGWVLVENHCPICAAATSCQKLCEAELRIFGDVLGPEARVEREEHIVAGARRCAYRIEALPRRKKRRRSA